MLCQAGPQAPTGPADLDLMPLPIEIGTCLSKALQLHCALATVSMVKRWSFSHAQALVNMHTHMHGRTHKCYFAHTLHAFLHTHAHTCVCTHHGGPRPQCPRASMDDCIHILTHVRALEHTLHSPLKTRALRMRTLQRSVTWMPASRHGQLLGARSAPPCCGPACTTRWSMHASWQPPAQQPKVLAPVVLGMSGESHVRMEASLAHKCGDSWGSLGILSGAECSACATAARASADACAAFAAQQSNRAQRHKAHAPARIHQPARCAAAAAGSP